MIHKTPSSFGFSPPSQPPWASRPPVFRADHSVKVVDTRNDKPTDGFLLARGGHLRKPTSALRGTPGVLPNNGATPVAKAFLVNGIMTDAKLHLSDMQALANTGLEVVGIRNATEGFFPDLTQSLFDKLRVPTIENPATSTVRRLVLEAVETDESLVLIGHSQGALIISAGLRAAAETLLANGLSPEEVATKLARVRVETYGGAAATYIDGPDYWHTVNRLDPVPMLTGVGLPLSQPGRDARIRFVTEGHAPTDLPDIRKGVNNWFARVVDRTVHGPQDVYFDERTEWFAGQEPTTS